jgi:hypothetical protein
MKNNIRTKLILISLLTLLVAVGGTMLYHALLEDMKLEAFNMNKEIYIVSSPRIYSSGMKSGNKTARYKPSGRNSSAQLKPMNMDVKRDNSIMSGLNASRSSLALSSSFSGQSVTKRKSKDDFNSGGGTGMISQIQATGRSRSSFLSSEGGSSGGGLGRTSLSSDYSSATGNLTAPLLANGLDGDDDDPSDELPPPTGAPVGDELWVLLMLALGYVGWKKNPQPPETSTGQAL